MSEHDLTPAQEESVRALLAAARHAEPPPAPVLTRLDEALATLVAERREGRAPVVTLASRRRRVASMALLAAAAVVVVGVGITQVLPSLESSGGDSSATSAESFDELESGQEGRDLTPGEAASRSAAGAAPSELSAAEKAPLSADSASGIPVVDPSTALKPQVRDLRPTTAGLSFFSGGCLVDRSEFEDGVSVLYDGARAVLVYRLPVAGRQRVDVYPCGASDPARSVQIPAR